MKSKNNAGDGAFEYTWLIHFLNPFNNPILVGVTSKLSAADLERT